MYLMHKSEFLRDLNRRNFNNTIIDSEKKRSICNKNINAGKNFQNLTQNEQQLSAPSVKLLKKTTITDVSCLRWIYYELTFMLNTIFLMKNCVVDSSLSNQSQFATIPFISYSAWHITIIVNSIESSHGNYH